MPELVRIPAQAVTTPCTGGSQARVLRRMFIVIDVDLSRYFDNIRHSILLDKLQRGYRTL